MRQLTSIESVDDCKICFKIRCKRCGWEPDKKELALIQSGVLNVCPVCGWMPGSEI